MYVCIDIPLYAYDLKLNMKIRLTVKSSFEMIDFLMNV